MDGIEVANSVDGNYYPEAHRWAIEKNLAIIGNSDVHNESGLDLDRGQRRGMTLVFARERSPEAIREALDERRSVAFFEGTVIGTEEWVHKLFEACVTVERISRGEKQTYITLRNNSLLGFDLVKRDHDPRLAYFKTQRIVPFGRLTINVRHEAGIEGGFEVRFDVDNMLAGPDKGLEYKIVVK